MKDIGCGSLGFYFTTVITSLVEKAALAEVSAKLVSLAPLVLTSARGRGEPYKVQQITMKVLDLRKKQSTWKETVLGVLVVAFAFGSFMWMSILFQPSCAAYHLIKGQEVCIS